MLKNKSITKQGIEALKLSNIKGVSRRRILDFLSTNRGFICINSLKNKVRFSNSSINTLLRDKYILVKESEINYNPLSSIKIPEKKAKLTLSFKQNEILEKINNFL